MVMDTLGDTIKNLEVETLFSQKGQKNRKLIIFETLATSRIAGRFTSLQSSRGKC